MPDKITLPVFPYLDQTEEEIRGRMLEKVSDEWDKTEGSFIWDSLSPAAIEFATTYIRAKEVLEWGFALTTFGGYLDARAAERGMYRRPAQTAAGRVQITGLPGVYVPEGALFASEVDLASASEPIYYVTTEDGTIPDTGVISLPVRCTVEGSQGNVPASVVTVAVTKIAGLNGITNPESIVDGADVETDEAFLARYLEQVRNPGASGNIADYIRWAREADTLVGKVRVLPLFDGPGTVSVVIVDIDDQPASPTLIEKVQTYIDPSAGKGEGTSPIGAKVTVSTPVVKKLDIAVLLTVIRGYDSQAVKANVQASIRTYLRSLVLNGTDNDIRFSKIGNAIGATDGVQDYEELTLTMGAQTGVTRNLSISDNEMAVLGTITWL